MSEEEKTEQGGAEAEAEAETGAETEAEAEAETGSAHGHHHGPRPGEEPRWLDDPGNVRKLVYLTYGLCGFLVLTHVLGLVGVYDLHGHYSWETWPGFYALYGFGAYMALVVLAEVLRAAVQKSTTYYDAFEDELIVPEPEDPHGHAHHGDGGH